MKNMTFWEFFLKNQAGNALAISMVFSASLVTSSAYLMYESNQYKKNFTKGVSFDRVERIAGEIRYFLSDSLNCVHTLNHAQNDPQIKAIYLQEDPNKALYAVDKPIIEEGAGSSSFGIKINKYELLKAASLSSMENFLKVVFEFSGMQKEIKIKLKIETINNVINYCTAMADAQESDLWNNTQINNNTIISPKNDSGQMIFQGKIEKQGCNNSNNGTIVYNKATDSEFPPGAFVCIQGHWNKISTISK